MDTVLQYLNTLPAGTLVGLLLVGFFLTMGVVVTFGARFFSGNPHNNDNNIKKWG